MRSKTLRLNPFLQRPCCFWLNYIPTGGDDCDAVILPCRYIYMRKHLLEPLSESLCQLFWLLQIGRIRFPQQCHKVAWGSKYSQYIVTFMTFSYIFLYFANSHAISCNDTRIHLNKGIRHIKILHYHIHFLQNCSIFSPFYDWHCSKFLRCTEFWSGIEEKGISDLQFSTWIVVTIKLLTLTNFPSLWHSFFLNMS